MWLFCTTPISRELFIVHRDLHFSRGKPTVGKPIEVRFVPGFMGTASPAGPTGAGSVVPAHLPWSMPALLTAKCPPIRHPAAAAEFPAFPIIPQYSKYLKYKHRCLDCRENLCRECVAKHNTGRRAAHTHDIQPIVGHAFQKPEAAKRKPEPTSCGTAQKRVRQEATGTRCALPSIRASPFRLVCSCRMIQQR